MLRINKRTDQIPVFDLTVEGNHNFFCNGVLVHNCGEIILRPNEFCNLSEVVVRENDTPESLKRKVRLATILGTFQSTLTNFKYISKKWQKNCEEERLLGVSLTGIMDNTLTSGRQGLDKLAVVLTDLREYTVEVNKEFAAALGINPSVAITTQKPSGCTTLDTAIKTTDGIRSMADIFARNTDDLFDILPGTWIKPIEDITVFDRNNMEKKVTSLFVNGLCDVYRIEDEHGNVYKFTPEHKLLTVTGWKRVDQLSVDDEVVSF